MGAQEIVVGVLVVGAVVWLARALVLRARGGGCECTSASICPYAGAAGCPLSSASTGEAGEGAEDETDE